MILVVFLVKKHITLVLFPIKYYLGSPQRKKPFFGLFLCVLSLITPKNLKFLIRIFNIIASPKGEANNRIGRKTHTQKNTYAEK
jgi:hypothetical protein